MTSSGVTTWAAWPRLCGSSSSSFSPFLGVLIYLIARGGEHARASRGPGPAAQKAFDSYVRQTAGGSSQVDQLAKLADLKEKGVLSDAEFEAQKAKLLT